MISDVASYHSALNYTTSQSIESRFIDFKTCTLNYNCGARRSIQKSNSATIHYFDLISSCPVPRRDGTIVSLLSRIVGFGVKLAGTTSSLHSSIQIKLSEYTELLICKARWTRSPDCKLLINKLAHFVRQLRHISIPQPAGLDVAHGTKRVLLRVISFLSAGCSSFCSVVARVQFVDVVVVQSRKKI